MTVVVAVTDYRPDGQDSISGMGVRKFLFTNSLVWF
jgi:hypothetical protein